MNFSLLDVIAIIGPREQNFWQRHKRGRRKKKVTMALLLLLPVSCLIFVSNIISVIKKVNKDDNIDTIYNTIGATLGLLLITGAIIATCAK